MEHEMRLSHSAFSLIAEGKKKIEVRLNDEKRRLVGAGDMIAFTDVATDERLCVKVTGVYGRRTFAELYRSFAPSLFGGETAEELIENIYTYYTREQEEKYGVVGIAVEPICRK